MKRLLDAYRAAPAIHRRIVLTVLVLAGALLYGWLLLAAGEARNRLQTTVDRLQGQAMQLERDAAEYTKLRATPAVRLAQADLRTLVQSHADQAGLSAALVKIDALDKHRVQLAFGAVAFADWLEWIRTLQGQQARLESCRIEALSTPGLVSITAQLNRASAP